MRLRLFCRKADGHRQKRFLSSVYAISIFVGLVDFDADHHSFVLTCKQKLSSLQKPLFLSFHRVIARFRPNYYISMCPETELDVRFLQ